MIHALKKVAAYVKIMAIFDGKNVLAVSENRMALYPLPLPLSVDRVTVDRAGFRALLRHLEGVEKFHVTATDSGFAVNGHVVGSKVIRNGQGEPRDVDRLVAFFEKVSGWVRVERLPLSRLLMEHVRAKGCVRLDVYPRRCRTGRLVVTGRLPNQGQEHNGFRGVEANFSEQSKAVPFEGELPNRLKVAINPSFLNTALGYAGGKFVEVAIGSKRDSVAVRQGEHVQLIAPLWFDADFELLSQTVNRYLEAVA